MAIDFTEQEVPYVAELYTIVYKGNTLRYAASKIDIVFGGNAYTAATISRGEIEKESDLNVAKCKITLFMSALLQDFIKISPPSPIAVTIVRFQIDTLENDVIFVGEVSKISYSQNNQCEVEVTEQQKILYKTVPIILFQSLCNHSLYDAGCGLTRGDYAFTAEIYSVEAGGSLLVSDDLNSFAENYFSWGTCEFENDIRMITRHDGAHLNLHVPFDGIEAGDEVVCYAGCDLSASTCKNKFNNLANFLGFPYIPKKNPVYSGI